MASPEPELTQCARATATMATGLLLCTAWYFTILAGFFTLYCPVMYLMFVSHKLYRKLVDCLFALWELYPVALFQCIYKTQLHHYGDYVDPDENTIMILNHRTRVDWNYVWIALYHATQESERETCICKRKLELGQSDCDSLLDLGGRAKTKFVLKDELKGIPGMGWIMQLNYFLYVKRDWREDQLCLSQFVDYYTKLKVPVRLALFPEGTDLSDDNKRKSDTFALQNHLPKYSFVLHPRTTGWVALCSRMRSELASVYDVTLAYDTPAQTEADLLRGNMPRHVYFHFKRYSINELPYEDEGLRRWLHDRWSEKETNLRNFFAQDCFSNSSYLKLEERPSNSMVKAKMGFAFWTLTDCIFIYFTINSLIFQFWLIYHSLLFIFATRYFGGFHNIQYKLSYWKNCF